MEEQRKGRFDIGRLKKIDHLWHWCVIAVLVLVLGIEGIIGLGIRLKSSRFTSSGQQVVAATTQTAVQGVSLYATGKDFVIDNAFLMKLSSFHSEGVNAVRIPMDFSAHVYDFPPYQVDGDWMKQTASIMEMIFQSNYHVILSVRMPEGVTDPAYFVSLWEQIDAACGHRPADELWYDFTIPEGVTDIAAWQTAYQQVAAKVQANNPRTMLFTLPSGMSDTDMTNMLDMMKAYESRVAVYYQSGMTAEQLGQLKQKAGALNIPVVLMEAEGDAAQSTVGSTIKDLATMYGFGYLLQGD